MRHDNHRQTQNCLQLLAICYTILHRAIWSHCECVFDQLTIIFAARQLPDFSRDFVTNCMMHQIEVLVLFCLSQICKEGVVMLSMHPVVESPCILPVSRVSVLLLNFFYFNNYIEKGTPFGPDEETSSGSYIQWHCQYSQK